MGSLAALASLAAAPAHAGYWKITMTGAYTVPSPLQGGSFTDGVDSHANEQYHHLTLSSSSSPYTPNRSNAQARVDCYPLNGGVSLTATAKLTWTHDSVPPGYPQDTSLPPTTVCVAETGSAQAGQAMYSSTNFVNTVSDGFNSPPYNDPVVRTSTEPYGPGHGTDQEASSTGSHLSFLTVPAGQNFVMLPTRTLSASVTWATGQGGAPPIVQVTYYVQLDNRAVAVICPEIEAPTSYRKSYVDSAHLDGKWPNVRDTSTGQISVNTVVTRASGEYVASASPNGNRFIGQTSNFTHPYYTWAFQGVDGQVGLYGQQFLGVENDQFQAILLNFYFGSSTSGFPKFTQIQLTARDGFDNATGVTTYGVHWHLPVENWILTSSVPTTNRLYPDLATDPDGNTEIEPNRTVNYSIPTAEIDIAGPLFKTASVFLAGAGAAAPELLPESFAAGPGGVIVVTALAVGSAGAGFLVPPDPGKDTGHTNYEDYIYAVNQQKIVNDTGQGMQRFDPGNVDKALQNFAILQAR